MLLLFGIVTIIFLAKPAFNGFQDFIVIERNRSHTQFLNNSQVSTCKNGTILLRNQTVLLGKNITTFWQPWLQETFPLCSSFLQQLKCLRRFNVTKNHYLYYKPCKWICNRALQSCQMLHQFVNSKGDIDFLGCQKYEISRPCSRSQLPSETLPQCGYPLVTSAESRNWIVSWNETIDSESEVRGCSLACNRGFLISSSVQRNVNFIVVFVVFAGFVASLFSILSFAIDWRCQKRYPAFILFILNVCFLFCFGGWILQFFIKNVACDEKLEKRMGEPRSLKSLGCVFSFILIYFSSMAISCWFVLLTYSWKISFKKLGTKENRIGASVKYFHMIGWSVPTLFTMIVTLSGNIDGDEISSICFVGNDNLRVRLLLVVTPYIFALLLGEFFLASGIVELYKLRANCRLFLIPKATLNITYTLYRLMAYGLVTFVAVVIAISPLIYADEARWKKDFANYVRCSIPLDRSFSSGQCILPKHHKVLFFYLQIFGLLLNCLITSSWTWTRATIKTWVKVWKRYWKVDAQFMAQRSWYLKLKKKKIRPFVPPVNQDHPFTSRLPDELSRDDNRKQNSVETCSSFTKLLRDLTKSNTGACPSNTKYKQKQDIRTVVGLFSSRRGSKLSITSFEDLSDTPLSKKGRLTNNIQSFGHLTRGCRSSDDLSAKALSANMAVEFNGERLNTLEPNMSLERLQFVRDVCTPLSMVHKNHIVADCIPYDLSSFKSL